MYFPVSEARRVMANVEKQAMYLSHRQVDIDDIQVRKFKNIK